MTTPVDDERLMSRVRGGDEDALEVLVRRYSLPLLSYLVGSLASRAEAEDVFQEVWLAVWVKRRTFDTTRRFRPWVFRIAANRCVDRLRRRHTHLNATAAVGDLAATQETARMMHRVETREMLEHVGRAIEQLPRNEREVVSLRVFASLGYAEISEILKVTESTARSTMSHALQALRRRLAPLVEAGTIEEDCDGLAESRRGHRRSR